MLVFNLVLILIVATALRFGFGNFAINALMSRVNNTFQFDMFEILKCLALVILPIAMARDLTEFSPAHAVGCAFMAYYVIKWTLITVQYPSIMDGDFSN